MGDAGGSPVVAETPIQIGEIASFDIRAGRRLARFPLNMELLHAYWRMDYIEAPRPLAGSRIFTELPALGDDRAALIVHRSRLAYLMLNRFPYNAGHLLVIPFREAADLEDLSLEERADLMDTLVLGKKILRVALKPDGFNVGFNLGSAAGGSIPHLHGHIVPRWNGDTNFMPVLGQTRVLPQALEATWERLVAVTGTIVRPA
jgi:ATP adenylyltransferase